MDKLLMELNVCTELIAKGQTANIAWLNRFCAEFHKFASKFKKYLAPMNNLEGNKKIYVETIYLCFTQVLTCITQLERTINIESTVSSGQLPEAGAGPHLLLTRTHFLDRIEWCLRRLQTSLHQLAEEAIVSTVIKLEDLSFVELLDLALDKLETHNEIVELESKSCVDSEVDLAEEHDQLANQVSYIIRHALAFANVALESDKKALTAICETVMDESAKFERNFMHHNPGERKLEALSLQRALYSLETYLNEALLRLIFASLSDLQEVSLNRLKHILKKSETSKAVEQLISDFDNNMDRIQQIGVFAIAFTPHVKTKTIIRSCLASLESLDASIVPAFQLQTTPSAERHADILEHHFREELMVFRNVIHEIIDSRALIDNYLDILAESIDNAKTFYPKGHLLQVAQMGNVLFQHFQLKVNHQELVSIEKGKRLYLDFVAILRECQASLELSVQVDIKRIVKRLKILYSILVKLRDVLDRIFNQVSACNGEKSLSVRKHSFANPEKGNLTVRCQKTMSSNSLNNESDLISFQLTEILRFY